MKYSELEDPTLVLEKLMADSGRDGAGQAAYKYFTHKYFRPIPNETSEPIKRMQMLIPGRFYTYKYDPLYKDKLDFYDTRPIMLCIKTYIHPNHILMVEYHHKTFL